MRKLTVAALLIFSMCCLMSACAVRSETDVIVAGSTSVQPYAEILAEEYMRLHSGSSVDVQGGGSSAGITAAQSGTADIGMSSRHLKENEQSLWYVEIAKDGLALIVHQDNPIRDLSLEQIRDIYTGKASNWSEMGGADHKIHLIAREEGSGTRSAFEELVMGDEQITPKAIVQNSNGAVRLLVSSDPNAIGFISLGIVDQTVVALRLDGIEPTRENVINGSYSLYRPFLFVMNDEPDGEAKQFIDYILSPEGQQVLVHEGLVPVLEEPK